MLRGIHLVILDHCLIWIMRIDPEFKDVDNIRASAGIGLSWRSPFGPIRVDLAHPFASENFDQEETFRFNFELVSNLKKNTHKQRIYRSDENYPLIDYCSLSFRVHRKPCTSRGRIFLRDC